MSSVNSTSKDFLNTEKLTSETQFHGSYNNPLATFLDDESVNVSPLLGSQRSKKNMSDTVSLFRKYLLDKVHQNMGKIDATEVEAVKSQQSACCRLFLPRDSLGSPRWPSLLEQELLPEFSCDGKLQMKSQASNAQLTIFYSGGINVYDNIPFDKARTIMLLASKISCANSVMPNKPTAPVTLAAASYTTALPSICKLQSDLPMARKNSLRRFLDKRRSRIMNNAPYATVAAKQEIMRNQCPNAP